MGLEQQKNQANGVVKGLIEKRGKYIVDDADTSKENTANLKVSMSAMLVAQLDGKKDQPIASLRDNPNDNGFWEQKGQQVFAKSDMPLRCAECAALVVHVLRNDPNFNLPLAMVELGNAGIQGHWFVVAGMGPQQNFADDSFGTKTFTIDLWGYATKNSELLIVGPPGTRPFNMVRNQVSVRARWN